MVRFTDEEIKRFINVLDIMQSHCVDFGCFECPFEAGDKCMQNEIKNAIFVMELLRQKE